MGFRRGVVAALLVYGASVMLACGSNGGNATTSTPSATPPPLPRIINLAGTLSFGDVAVGNSAALPLTIANVGTSNLTVNSITASAEVSNVITGSFAGMIAGGASQQVTI